MSNTKSTNHPEAVVAGGLTQQQIDSLKNKHGKLTLVTVEFEEGKDDKHFWFKKPDSKTMSAVMKIAETDPFRSTQIYFKSCLIKGDAACVDDMEVFMNVAPHLERLIEERKTVVKNF